MSALGGADEILWGSASIRGSSVTGFVKVNGGAGLGDDGIGERAIGVPSGSPHSRSTGGRCPRSVAKGSGGVRP